MNPVIKKALNDIIIQAEKVETDSYDGFLSEAVTTLEQAFRAQDQILSEVDVARRWPFLNRRWLQTLRFRHEGPKYMKFGRERNSKVGYRVSDIEAWIVENYQLEPFVLFER